MKTEWQLKMNEKVSADRWDINSDKINTKLYRKGNENQFKVVLEFNGQTKEVKRSAIPQATTVDKLAREFYNEVTELEPESTWKEGKSIIATDGNMVLVETIDTFMGVQRIKHEWKPEEYA